MLYTPLYCSIRFHFMFVCLFVCLNCRFLTSMTYQSVSCTNCINSIFPLSSYFQSFLYNIVMIHLLLFNLWVTYTLYRLPTSLTSSLYYTSSFSTFTSCLSILLRFILPLRTFCIFYSLRQIIYTLTCPLSIISLNFSPL